MIRRSRVGAAVLLFAAVAFLIIGCGGGGGGAPSSKTPEDTLVIALEAEPPELDPAYSSAYVDRQVMASLYDKLVDIDENGKIVPMLARSWDVSDDGKTYTFKLRDGVKFHDGTELDAGAVKTNFERYMTKESTRSTEVRAIKSVEVMDPLTVRVNLSEPFSPFLSVLADRAGIMVSPKAVEEQGGRISQNPVGTGPFKFVERRRGQAITLKRNEDYWQEGKPEVQKIEYRGIADENVQYQNLRSGELDIIDSIPFVEFKNLRESGDYKVNIQQGLGYQGFFLNTRQPPFNNKKLRQAVYNLVDREAIVKAALRGVGGDPGNSPFSKASFAYSKESDSYDAPNVQEAKKLLREAGKPDGFSFTWKTGPSPMSQQIGRVIQNNMEAAGIKVKLEQIEFGTLLEQATNGDFQALQLGWSGRIDPDQNIYDFMVTGGNNNDAGYSNPEVDRLLNEARRISDEAKRKELYTRAMEIIHEDVPYVYLYHNNSTTDFAFQKNVTGFTPYPDGILRTVKLNKQSGE